MEPGFAIERRDSTPLIWFKRVAITVVCIHLLLSAWSTSPRNWQVLRIKLRVSSPILAAGETVSYDVVTSGETHNRILLELVQGTHSETLFEERSRVSAVNTYDPRLFEYEKTVTVTPELLERFAPGPATLRLTGFGGPKFFRTPAPRIREVKVELRR